MAAICLVLIILHRMRDRIYESVCSASVLLFLINFWQNSRFYPSPHIRGGSAICYFTGLNVIRDNQPPHFSL
jgi:hypothetical protein